MEELSQLKVMRDLARGRLDVKRREIETQLVALTRSPDAKLIKSLNQLISDIENSIAIEPVHEAPSIDNFEAPETNLDDMAKQALEAAFSQKASVEEISSAPLAGIEPANLEPTNVEPANEMPTYAPNDLESIAAQLRANMAQAGH
ncbi:MAG: hypothetical protein AB8B49_10435 [Nitratireductor sp.]